MIKHSILLKIQKYDGNLCGLASIVYTKFLIKNLQVMLLKVKLSQTKIWLKNYTNYHNY